MCFLWFLPPVCLWVLVPDPEFFFYNPSAWRAIAMNGSG